MEKQQLITLIEQEIGNGTLSREELVRLVQTNGGIATVSASTSTIDHEKSSTPQKVTHTLYLIGAVIAVIGVGILLGQNWEKIGGFGRIISTLGISFATYAAALMLTHPEQGKLSQVLFCISAILAPFGAMITLREVGIDFTTNTQAIVAIVLVIIYGTSFIISRKGVLIPIILIFATWAYFVLMDILFGVNLDEDVLKWATMLLGISYLLFAYSYQFSHAPVTNETSKGKDRVQNFVAALGTLLVLGPGIMIGGAFDLFFILVIFAAFYGSVYLKSRTTLTLASLFLIAHIIKLTSKYFVNSIGWPVALIIIGFAVIGVGYFAVSFSRRFITAQPLSEENLLK